jgi:peptide/nickel transport system permease protein
VKRSRYLLARLAWTVFAVWLVLSTTFFFFALTPDKKEPRIAYFAGGGEAGAEAVEEYNERRGYDDPLLDRYVRWLGAYATFDWGYSFTFERPVTDVLVDRSKVTLSYLVPTALVSILVGTLVGVAAAMRERSVLDSLGRGIAYLGLSLPNFWLAEILLLVGLGYLNVFAMESYGAGASPYSPGNVPLVAAAGLAVGVNLLGVQVRYTYTETRGHLPEAFVKLLRSTGTSGVGVGRHLLRNAAVPLSALLFSDVLVTTLVNVVVVETVLGVPGVGAVLLTAIEQSDLGLIVGTWMLPVLVVLLGGLCQDLLTTALDPTVGTEA